MDFINFIYISELKKKSNRYLNFNGNLLIISYAQGNGANAYDWMIQFSICLFVFLFLHTLSKKTKVND